MVLLAYNNNMQSSGQVMFDATSQDPLKVSMQSSMGLIKQEVDLEEDLLSPLSSIGDKENVQQVKSEQQGSNNSSNKKKQGLSQKSGHGISAASLTISKPKGPSMGRRNARERNRVRYLNMTFEVLRTHLPQKVNNKGKAKKMSKVDTLRSAIDYIRGLQDLLDENDAVNAAFQSTAVATALSEADTLSPTHSYTPDGSISPCSMPSHSPTEMYPSQSPEMYSTLQQGAPDFTTPVSMPGLGAPHVTAVGSGDSAIFSEEDGEDLIDITSWFQC